MMSEADVGGCLNLHANKHQLFFFCFALFQTAFKRQFIKIAFESAYKKTEVFH